MGELYLHRGLAYVALTEFEKGITDFMKAKETVKSSSDKENNKYRILLNLGINLRRVGRAKESIQYLQAAVTIKPQAPQGYNNLGLSYYETMELQDAI